MKIKCCFCGKEIDDIYSNNPEPLMSAPNRCCVDCNYSKVIPARFKALQKDPREEANKIYIEHGYDSREDYLRSLAEEYGVDLDSVKMLANLYGKSEDFDGLVNAVQELADETDFWSNEEYDDYWPTDEDEDEDPDGYLD